MPLNLAAPARTPAQVADRPTWLISRAFARSSGLLARAFEEEGDGLRGYHFRLLAALEEWGPASQAGLGRDTGIDRSDVTAAIVELEARGLVSRHMDPLHKRRKIVTITAEGCERLKVLDAIVGRVQRQLLAPLKAEERRQFVALLRRITQS